MSASFSILVVDDEEVMRDCCVQILSRDGCRVEVADDGLAGLERIREEPFDVVILDLKMPGLNGLDLLDRIAQTSADTVVIVMTGYASVESAVEAMRHGAYDFIPKPFPPRVLRGIVARALERRGPARDTVCPRSEFETLRGVDSLVGQSVPMKATKQLVKRAAATDSTVLIAGESGTGKELVARALHHHSARRDGPFVTVDSGGLVANLIESDLFGHVRGAFTGATSTRQGRFELAHGGTLFLDDVSTLGWSVQGKLLRALQEREITRVGSGQVIKVDVRIIAATNSDLLADVAAGGFREDLFYRLSVIPINLPPLRERKEDIPHLADFFLRKYNAKRAATKVRSISEEALSMLADYDWPGNVRELENVIERAVVLADSETVRPLDLVWHQFSSAVSLRSARSARTRLEDIEKEHIRRTLATFNRHKAKTAEALGIDRKTLRNKMRRYNIEED
jgi:two-component system response regulator HydG